MEQQKRENILDGYAVSFGLNEFERAEILTAMQDFANWEHSRLLQSAIERVEKLESNWQNEGLKAKVLEILNQEA